MKPSELKAGDVLVAEYDTYTVTSVEKESHGDIPVKTLHRMTYSPVCELCPGERKTTCRSMTLYFNAGMPQYGILAVYRDGNLIWGGRKDAEEFEESVDQLVRETVKETLHDMNNDIAFRRTKEEMFKNDL